MKVEQAQKAFTPLSITLESLADLEFLKLCLELSLTSFRNKKQNIYIDKVESILETFEEFKT